MTHTKVLSRFEGTIELASLHPHGYFVTLTPHDPVDIIVVTSRPGEIDLWIEKDFVFDPPSEEATHVLLRSGDQILWMIPTPDTTPYVDNLTINGYGCSP